MNRPSESSASHPSSASRSSPATTACDIQERFEDYLAAVVPAVCVLDPRRRRAYSATPSGAVEPALAQLTIAGPEIRVPIPDIFAELDELEAGS